MGEMGAAAAITGILSIAAMPSFQRGFTENGRPVSASPLAWIDMNLGFPIAGSAVFPLLFAASQIASQAITQSTTTTRRPDGHHTVPKYVCGHPNQLPLAVLDSASHSRLHSEMVSFETTVETAFQNYFGKTPQYLSYANIPAFRLLSKTGAGRAQTVSLLDSFYTEKGWSAVSNINDAFVKVSSDFRGGEINPVCGVPFN